MQIARRITQNSEQLECEMKRQLAKCTSETKVELKYQDACVDKNEGTRELHIIMSRCLQKFDGGGCTETTKTRHVQPRDILESVCATKETFAEYDRDTSCYPRIGPEAFWLRGCLACLRDVSLCIKPHVFF